MNNLLNQYRELLARTQLFLHQEYSYHKMLPADRSTFAHFSKELSPKLVNPTTQLKSPAALAPQPLKIQTPLPSTSSPAVTARPVIPPQIKPIPAEPKQEKKVVKASDPLPQASVLPPQTGKLNPTAKNLVLEPFSAPAPQDLSDYWKLHRQLLPDLKLHETQPKDCVAIKIKNAWVNEQTIPPVVILSFRDVEKELLFLRSVAQAITLRLAPARVIPVVKWAKENGWENLINAPNLRLVIATDYDLYLQPELMKYYRESPQQGKHYLNNAPLLLLSDLSLYLKEPQLKSLLWRAICNEFASPHLSRS